MPLPLVVAPLVPAAKAVAVNVVVKTGGALLGKKALMTAGARAAVLLASTPKVAVPLAPKWLTPVVSVGTGATAFLASIWAALNKPKVKPDAPTYPSVEGTFDVGVPAGQAGWLTLNITVRSVRGEIRLCENDKVMAPAYDKQENTVFSQYNVVGPVTVTQKVAVFNFECGSGGNYGEAINLGVLRFKTADGDDAAQNLTPTYMNGGNKGNLYNTSPETHTVTLDNWKFDDQPIPNPIPTPKPDPQPRPDPVPTPEAEPSMLPGKPEVVPIVKPAPITVPDAQPTTEPQPAPITPPGRQPVKVPTKVPTTTPTPNKTPLRPINPRNTDIAGQIEKPAGSKFGTFKVTPKDAHKFGNDRSVRPQGVRPSLSGLAGEVGRIEQKLNQIANPKSFSPGDLFSLMNLLSQFLEPQAPEGVYKLQAACECSSDDPDCVEPEISRPVTGGHMLQAIGDRCDAIAELLQPLKTWKQPICSSEKPVLEGDFRTISFISDARSPDGRDRLRKRFRYRSQSGIDLAELVDHWKDFVWDAGPVCVQHSGHTWGTPQVWAATAEEGKRVIQHAGREAGVDPDQVGKWTIGGSSNPRFGMPGRMRVNTAKGFYWITERLGSNGKSIVVET